MYKIDFDPIKHIYTVTDKDGNSKTVNSVTTILEEEKLTKYWNKDKWYWERGKAIHSATQMIDKGTLNWATVEQYKGFLEAYVKFIYDTGWKWEHAEKPLYHPIYDYAGTPDRFLPLLDVKAGEGFPIQLEAYGELLRANGYDVGLTADMLHLKANGKYSLKPYKFNKTDRGVFLCAVVLNSWKRRMK